MDPSKKVYIFDTTLRDGEQSPGISMTLEEKIRIAAKLESMNVDVIEAGFPVASKGELQSVKAIAQSLKKAEIAALCRTREGDIKAAWEAIEGAANKRFHTFIATSKLHLKHKLKMTEQEVLKQIEFGVGTCFSLHEKVEFSAEDATRSDIGFLQEALSCALENGASILNIPDTVGYIVPDEYFKIIEAVSNTVEAYRAKTGADREIIISTHCHNDLGLAVSNSLAGIQAGARQVECCVNGIGERAGNAAMEEIVMALKTRRNNFECDTDIDTTQLLSASKLVSRISGFPVPPNKAIVGINAFAHESGIHQQGMLNERSTYEIMKPEDVGFNDSNLFLGKHSGRAALGDRLITLGYKLEKEELDRVFVEFKALTDKKKYIYDEDLHAIVTNKIWTEKGYLNLVRVEFLSGNQTEPTTKVTLAMGETKVESIGTGDGPINATIEAIKNCINDQDIELTDYSLSAITKGSDAIGKANVTLSKAGRAANGQSSNTDVLVATAEAIVAALNNLGIRPGLESSAKTTH